MRISPDEHIFWQHGAIKLNATIAMTWLLMLILSVGAKAVTSQLTRPRTPSARSSID